AIREHNVGQRAPVLVLAMHLNRDLLSNHQSRRRVLGFLFERLAFLRAVDPAEANPFRMFLVENFYRITVEDTDHGAGKLGGHGGCGKPQGKEHGEEQEHPHMVAGWSPGSEEVISTAETARDTRLDSSDRRRSRDGTWRGAAVSCSVLPV